MRILLVAAGSHGDVHPILSLGQEFQRRGHEALVFTSENFESAIRNAGLAPVLVGSVEHYEAVVRHPHAFHPRKGFKVIARAALEWTPELYRRLDEHVVDGQTVVVGSTLALAARLLAEKRDIPHATVHLSPSIIRSAIRPPVMGDPALPDWLPPAVVRGVWYLVDRWLVDPIVCPELNRIRAGLGLAPVERVFDEWIHRSALVVGMFPSWFAPPQPDWPRQVRLAGFTFFDGAGSAPLDPAVETFLDDGPPPVVFTSGTAVARERRFFEASVEACRLSGRRGLLLTRYPEQVPDELPPGVRHVAYAPFSEVFGRAAAVVHHGGIGTAAQALRAGVPQIVRPLAFDQFDNAHHLKRLGVARVIRPDRYGAQAVAGALDEVTSSVEMAEACATGAIRLRGADAAAEAVTLIERAVSSATSSR